MGNSGYFLHTFFPRWADFIPKNVIFYKDAFFDTGVVVKTAKIWHKIDPTRGNGEGQGIRRKKRNSGL